ncbi:Response regulator [Bacillus thuringiensis IBL 200]|nr:Response regulator [Bacillus thuringiensis IBL 200]
MPSLIKELSSAINILIFMFVSMDLPPTNIHILSPCNISYLLIIYFCLPFFHTFFHLALLQKIYYSFFTKCVG